MKKLMASLFLASLMATVGCNASPTGGRPATPAPSAGGPAHTVTGGSKETFKLEAPETSQTVKQGTSTKFNVSISRGADFKDDVAVTAEPQGDSKGLKVEVSPKEFKASDKKPVEVTVTASDDASLGKHVIQITGKPQAGTPTSVNVTVNVTAKEGNK
jgi:uncharacterized membrane protein